MVDLASFWPSSSLVVRMYVLPLFKKACGKGVAEGIATGALPHAALGNS